MKIKRRFQKKSHVQRLKRGKKMGHLVCILVYVSIVCLLKWLTWCFRTCLIVLVCLFGCEWLLAKTSR